MSFYLSKSDYVDVGCFGESVAILAHVSTYQGRSVALMSLVR